MATDEELKNEVEKIFVDFSMTNENCLITKELLIKLIKLSIKKGIDIGKKEGTQMERERLRKQVNKEIIDTLGGPTIFLEDIDIWGDVK